MASAEDVARVTVSTPAPPSKSESVKELFSMKGKFAIITGAGQGIGLEVAKAFAEQGADVAIWYNSNKDAVIRAEEIEKQYGVKCRAYKVSITDQDEVEKAVDDQVKEFGGKLDVLVANAGIPWIQGPILIGDLSHYRKVVSTNIDGVYFSARAAGKHFLQQHKANPEFQGSFIATASMSGHIVNYPQFQAVYNASKANVVHFCKSLSVEWAGFARSNTISPGYIATEISGFVRPEQKAIWHQLTPMRREGKPHELKGAYLLLASDAGSFMTGSDVIVDGGYCAP